jgi:O-antigen ligase
MIVRRSFIGPFLEFQGERDIENESSTYQSIGRNILATSIVFCALLDKFWKKILALSLTVVALLAVGSRAHLFAAAGVLAAIIALFMFRKRNIVAGVLFLVVVLVSSNVLVQLLLNTRAAELFDLAASTSWQARLRHQAVALDVLAQNPFFGDFGYHRGYGKSYAHNLLSAWTEYGAFAFFCFLGLCLYTLGLSAKRMLREHCSVLWQASFLLSLTALILAFGTESIFLAVFPPLAWGFTTNALRDEIRQKRLADISLASVARAGAERGWSRGVLV